MKNALVTGGSSGIGRATAECLRREGYRITVLDRSDPGAIADRWIAHDLNEPQGTLPEVDAPVHVLINAAGLPPREGTETKVLRVNFLALRRLTLALLPLIPEGGSIVNMASKAGARWRENLDQVRRLMAKEATARLDSFVAEEAIDPVRSYDLSKEAVIVWTKAMTAPLLARGLRMNCISPAAIDTPILADFKQAFGDRAERGMQLTHRAGTPGEVAEVIAFLAGERSGWVRGCNIEVDGGLAAMLDAEHLIGKDLVLGLEDGAAD